MSSVLTSPVPIRRDALAAAASPFDWRHRPSPPNVASGVPEFDALTGGIPRGSLTEITGPVSSGRTALLLALLAAATARDEVCALVDAADAFEPTGAAAAGVRLEKLLWIRCSGDAERALKAADLVVQGGGFGVVAMDLADTPPAAARRISMTSWFRLRRAVENTPTVLVAVAGQPNARTCASLVVECARERLAWTGARGCSQLLRGFEVSVHSRKPVRDRTARFRTQVKYA
jgi:hypothetical protein